MKRIVFSPFCSLIGAIFLTLVGQEAASTQTPCSSSSAQIDMDGNSLRARLLNGGDMFWDFSDGRFQPNYNGQNTPSSVFAAALWMGYTDPGGNLFVKAQDYRSGGRNAYWPGPLNDQGMVSANDCANWDRFFKVSKAEIDAFRADFADDGILQGTHTALKRWPASGNPDFQAQLGFALPNNAFGLAPFVDENQDGVYSIADGDYPAVFLLGKPPFVPDQMIYHVINGMGGIDGITGQNMPIEIHQLHYVFACPSDAVLDNALFSTYKIIHKGTENMNDFHFGIWVDYDLGCYTDDYIGSDPATQTVYAYNSQNVDNCANINSYGENPPVQALSFLPSPLGVSLHSVMPMFNPSVITVLPGMSTPNSPTEYYNYLRGLWKDGTPLTFGGNGYSPSSSDTALFAYSGDPNLGTNEWSMISTNQMPSDLRVIASAKLDLLEPGAIREINTVWSYHRRTGADNLENITAMKEEVPDLIQLFDGGFANSCSSSSSSAPIHYESSLLMPNPAQNHFQLTGVKLQDVQQILIADQTGRIVRTYQPNDSYPVHDLSNGIYVVRVALKNATLTGKLVVQR